MEENFLNNADLNKGAQEIIKEREAREQKYITKRLKKLIEYEWSIIEFTLSLKENPYHFLNKPSTKNNLPEPDRMHSSYRFPVEPINPEHLIESVSRKLISYGSAVPEKTATMVEELCKSFNECIRLNKADKDQTLILSPKTGSAKSLSSKMYVALLEEVSSIIVVYTVAEAIETCQHINEWSKDLSYARCTYSITDDNEDSSVRVERDKLSLYRCIVVSHAMFKSINNKQRIEQFALYNNKPREFVLIDERMDFYKETTFSLSNLQHLLKLFNDIKVSLPLPLVDKEIEYLNAITENFEVIKNMKELTLDYIDGKVVQSIDSKSFIHMSESLKAENNIDTYDFDNFYTMLTEAKISLQKVLDPLLLNENFDVPTVKKNLRKHLNDLANILETDFYYFARSGSDPVLMSTTNILNYFGSSVVLDATATVNALYEDKIYSNHETVKHIVTTNPKTYGNLTIHTCRGVFQSKTSIYGTLAPSELKEIVKLYKEIAYSLLETKKDKLLIVAHEEFKSMLEKTIKRKAVEFTYWGNHRGKNEWSHCNKVLVIGWYYLPHEVHYRNYINAINGTQNLTNDQLKEIKSNYELTQIVDDLVQAVNRGALRKTISADGNCTKSEVYLFYPQTTFGDNVMNKFIREFKNATVLPWSPVGIEKIRKLAKNYNNIERVVSYIEKKVEEDGEIKQSLVQKYFDEKNHPERVASNEERMPKSTVSNAMLHREFFHLLNAKGIYRVALNEKSFKFEKLSPSAVRLLNF